MSLLKIIASRFEDLFRLRDAAGKQFRNMKNRMDDLQAQIAALRIQPDGPLDAMLQNVHHLVPLIITEHIVCGEDATGFPSEATVPIEYFRARRIEMDPAPFAGVALNKWRKDPDDDIDDYFVMNVPGETGLFVGCRILAVLSHEAVIYGFDDEIQYQGTIFIPVAGEHRGFWAYINSTAIDGDPQTAWQYYQWHQLGTGLSHADSHYSGKVFAADGSIPAFTLPTALQLESISYDATFTGGYQEIPVDTPVFIRWVGGGWTGLDIEGKPYHGFVFNHYTLPLSDDECAEFTIEE